MPNKHFHSNGKLLLTGEYLILDGAMGLAVPTKKGQSLSLIPMDTRSLTWKSFDHRDKAWFETSFELPTLAIECNSRTETTTTLQRILREAQKLNPQFLKESHGCMAETHLDFPNDWGLGSSSTLINNIAQWAQVDAFALLQNSFSGSGYDIACAQNHTPILYKLDNLKPIVAQVSFDPPFKDQLFFVHLNQKQNSRDAIATYRNKTFDLQRAIDMVSQITRDIIKCSSLADFMELMDHHELLLSEVLRMPTIKSRLFPDYPGSIKSLGGWGGDFVLATGSEALEYFPKKGYKTVIGFKDMVLDSKTKNTT